MFFFPRPLARGPLLNPRIEATAALATQLTMMLDARGLRSGCYSTGTSRGS